MGSVGCPVEGGGGGGGGCGCGWRRADRPVVDEVSDCVFPTVAGGIVVPDGVGISHQPGVEVAHFGCGGGGGVVVWWSILCLVDCGLDWTEGDLHISNLGKWACSTIYPRDQSRG